MPDFGNPFSGNNIDKKLSKDELVRAIKFMIAAEFEASQMYDQVADATIDKKAEKVIRSISSEESVHAGEFLKLLSIVAPEEVKLHNKGQQEVQETINKKMTLSNYIRNLISK
jgi:rubrerythrin